jgi:glycine/D-amino acid oxidase-like deaminating enzyme/nitrite reductase/ring-hydroxylating ferredoxin subunit
MPEHDDTSGHNLPSWTIDGQAEEFPALSADETADVCVVGAGISGLTTAYLLCKQGRSVIVLDDGKIGSGETGRTSAHLATGLDDRYIEIERLHGAHGARLAAESHAQAIELIEAISEEEGIDCEFQRVSGYLFVPPGESRKILDAEFAAAHRAGLPVTLLESIPGITFAAGPCLRFPDQGQFQPMKYLRGLAAAVVRNGGRICNHTHVAKVQGGANASVTTSSGHSVRAGSIVVATNVPINDRVVMHTKLEPYRTYMIAARIEKDTMPQQLMWDTGDPYHYVRVQAGEGYDLLLIGGEDHKVGQAHDHAERFFRLEEWMRERFDAAGDVEFRWSGQIIETVDSLAYLGRNPMDDDNVYIITGDSGNGLTHGTIGAMLISDLITGRDNDWEKLYSPSRITLRATGEFTKHNASVAAHYSDWLTGGDVENAEQIACNSGAILRHGMGKIAAYRDDEGVMHVCSAKCPHLGGIVNWNDSEKTWDCPLHGSRFDRYGEVINGPANCNLTPIRIDDRTGATIRVGLMA